MQDLAKAALLVSTKDLCHLVTFLGLLILCYLIKCCFSIYMLTLITSLQKFSSIIKLYIPLFPLFPMNMKLIFDRVLFFMRAFDE
jgi:uncharacterized membrane protein (DUF373 family)